MSDNHLGDEFIQSSLYDITGVVFPQHSKFEKKLEPKAYLGDNIYCCGKRINDIDWVDRYKDSENFGNFRKKDFWNDDCCDSCNCKDVDEWDCRNDSKFFLINCLFLIIDYLKDSRHEFIVFIILGFLMIVFPVCSVIISVLLCDSYPSIGYLGMIPDEISWTLYGIHLVGTIVLPILYLFSYTITEDLSPIFVGISFTEFIATCCGISSPSFMHLFLFVEFVLVVIALFLTPYRLLKKEWKKEIVLFFIESSIISVGYRASAICTEFFFEVENLAPGIELSFYFFLSNIMGMIAVTSEAFGSLFSFSLYFAGICIGSDHEFRLTNILCIKYVLSVYVIIGLINDIYQFFAANEECDRDEPGLEIFEYLIMFFLPFILVDVILNINTEYSCYAYIMVLGLLIVGIAFICSQIDILPDDLDFRKYIYIGGFLIIIIYMICVCVGAPNGNYTAGLVVIQLYHSVLLCFLEIFFSYVFHEEIMIPLRYSWDFMPILQIIVISSSLCFNLSDIPSIVVRSIAIVIIIVFLWDGIHDFFVDLFSDCSTWTANFYKFFHCLPMDKKKD